MASMPKPWSEAVPEMEATCPAAPMLLGLVSAGAVIAMVGADLSRRKYRRYLGKVDFPVWQSPAGEVEILGQPVVCSLVAWSRAYISSMYKLPAVNLALAKSKAQVSKVVSMEAQEEPGLVESKLIKVVGLRNFPDTVSWMRRKICRKSVGSLMLSRMVPLATEKSFNRDSSPAKDELERETIP